jgi:hypothetical protein
MTRKKWGEIILNGIFSPLGFLLLVIVTSIIATAIGA